MCREADVDDFLPLRKKRIAEVFVNLDETPFIVCDTSLEPLGIEDCRPHKFRHTMATLMIRNGVDVKTVSEKLGHSSVEITLKLYVHSDEDTQKAANEKFASLVWNG